MENTLYYTFSTIAQVLSTIVGITGAFAMFRIQSIKDSLFGMSNDFYEFANQTYSEARLLPILRRLKTDIVYRKLDDIDPTMKEIVSFIDQLDDHRKKEDNIASLNNINLRFNALTNNLLQKKEDLKKILYVGFLTIILSIIVLSLTTEIFYPISQILLGLFIISTSYCFYLVYKYISSSLI